MFDRLRYISRAQDEAFRRELSAALEQPTQHPLLFNIWGMGGVGKTTLLNKLTDDYQKLGHPLRVIRFSLGEKPDEPDMPLAVMAALYEGLPDQRNDPFRSMHQQYENVRTQIQMQPTDGKTNLDTNQLNQIKQMLKTGVDLAEWLGLQKPMAEAGRIVSDKGVDAVATGLSLTDSLLDLLRTHRAVKTNAKLQQLILNPVTQLSAAFAQGLSQQARNQPVILLLDTYEKAPPEINRWLRRLLLDHRQLWQAQRVRVVVAGRYGLIDREEGWRKLQQDYDLVFTQALERFDPAQTAEYLAIAQLSELGDPADIYQVTKGLPYYLNWLRQNHKPGALNLAEGNRAIEKLLLQGLDGVKKTLLYLAACCRWFDRQLIQNLVMQHQIKAEPEQPDWFEWLTQQTFVQPVEHYYRLDDVARDVFRQSFCHDNRPEFERTHDTLANYFRDLSDHEVSSDRSPASRYNNPDWQRFRSEFLYYLLFTRRADLQLHWQSHLLEAYYFGVDAMVRTAFQAAVADGQATRQLAHATDQFLTQMTPGIDYGWVVFEPNSTKAQAAQTDYELSQSAINQAVWVCLGQVDRLNGLAKFAALFYNAQRGSDDQRYDWLMQAKAQAEQIVQDDDAEFSSGLFLWNIGDALYNLGRYEEAIASYDQAIAVKPDDHEAWYNRGVALKNVGRYEEAIASYDQAIAVKPDKHEAWYNRGNALDDVGRYEEAIASYDQAIAVKPDKHEAWYNRGIALKKVGRYEEAIASFDKSLEFLPDDAGAYYNKALCYSLQGNIDQSIAHLNRAIELDPDCREMAKTDSDFDAIRADDRFRAIIDG